MTPDHWQQLQSLFQVALDLSREQRAALLATADPELRAKVEAMLEQDSSKLDHPAWEVAPSLSTIETTTVTATNAQFTPGAQLGPYLVESQIGAGGMGVVLLASDTRLLRKVALKLLSNGGAADPSRKRRLLEEARAASALNHPNIVVLHDVAQHDGVEFLVMEYVPGKTLMELIPKEGLPVAQVAQIGAQVGSALAAAHAAGLVHRDIKPANIMVSSDGAAKVLDFGIAKSFQPAEMSGGSALTSPGMVVGTVSYMSPEQTRGEHVDGRSDIFSFGVVLYQAATGVLPFKSNSSLGVMDAIANLDPPVPSALRAGLPSEFDALVRRCLEKLPADRPQSAAQLAVELRSLAGSESRAIATTGRSTVAVVPFLLRGATAEDEFLPVALADAVIHRLNSSGKLLVRPTVSVMRYAGKETDWTQVARDLNVELVVDGSIQRAGRKIRILARAHRTGDPKDLYSAKLDGDLDDLFGLQDRLSESVYNALIAPQRSGQRPQSGELPARPAKVNPVAYELFLRAAERVTRINKWDTQSAIEMLTRATGIDPAFTDAWARLAQACVQMGVVFDSDTRWFRMAEDAVSRTLALDISNADALCARGQILWSPHHSYQNRQALRALNGALKLNPGCQQARSWRGLILFHLGLYAEAKEGLEEALAAHPEDMRSLVFLGHTALYRGDYEEAREFDERALAADPASVWPHLFYPTIPLYLGRPSEAFERLRTAREMVPEEPTLISIEAMIAAHEGQFTKAERLADEALTHTKSLLHTHHLWHNAAAVFSMSGKPERAVPLLRRCAEMGLPNYLLFGSDPHLAQLRGDRDFEALMSELRVEHELHLGEFGTASARR